MEGGFLEGSGLGAASKFCEPPGVTLFVFLWSSPAGNSAGRRGAELLESGDTARAMNV